LEEPSLATTVQGVYLYLFCGYMFGPSLAIFRPEDGLKHLLRGKVLPITLVISDVDLEDAEQILTALGRIPR
jgi:hypothetical protein